MLTRRRTISAQARVLDWYASQARGFPWRRTRRPYATLVAEVMLQQTQTGRVEPMYRAFLDRFPTLRSLAQAQAGDVIRAWRGLGYNRRAIRLHAAAVTILRDHAGRIPRDMETLRTLPGIGPYTASAVACFAYDAQIPVIDVNVRRVLWRAACGDDPRGVPDAEMADVARRWLPAAQAYAWNQALMDIGATLCRAGKPSCSQCPLARVCRFRAEEKHRTSKRTPPNRQEPFEGSRRQARGAIVEHLRRAARRGITVSELQRRVDPNADRIAMTDLLARLDVEGLVVMSPGARAGSPRGIVRLP